MLTARHTSGKTKKKAKTQKIFLPENSYFLIFTIFVKLEDRKKISKAAPFGLAQDLKLASMKNELC